MMELSLARARRMALAAQGFADPRPTGRGRPPPRAPGVRPRRPDPDRLGERARALAGAAAVRAARSAPARPAAEDARRRRAVRVLGARGVAAADRDAAVVPLAMDAKFIRWAGLRPDGARSIRTSSSAVYAEVAERGPDRAERHRRARRDVGAVVGLGQHGKQALAVLFWYGRLSARRRSELRARCTTCSERMLPTEHVDAPALTEAEARRAMVLRAARSLGVGDRRRPLRLLPAQRADDAPGDRRARRRGPAAARRGSRAGSSRRSCTPRRACRAGSTPARCSRRSTR